MHGELRDLIPVPRRVEPAEGTFSTSGRDWMAHPRVLAHTAASWKLARELEVNASARSGLPEYAVAIGRPEVTVHPPDHKQGYTLHVGPTGAVLRGADADGLYWGLVTLEQMLAGGAELPCCQILDWPAFPLRGHHDDISRKQVSRVTDFRRIIRNLSRYKINVYTPYMEDMLFLMSYPDIGRTRGRLMPSEVAAMHREAERHNVIIMPTFSLTGHQENLLSDPKYAHLGREVFQPMSSFDPAKPVVREFLRGIIGDVCQLFPGPFFHGGFDETQGLGAQEFLAHANWCARELRKYGKQMPMWVDMIYNHFGYEMIGDLEGNIIPVNWEYGCREGEIPHHRELCAQGRPVWGLAGYSSWCAFLPDLNRGRDNIDAWVRTGLETDTPALFGSQWGDNGYENHRDLAWNLFAYLGEGAWSGRDARRQDFERRFQLSFYGEYLPELREVTEDLPGQLNISAHAFWQHFRQNAYAMIRWAMQHPDAEPGLNEDEEALRSALKKVVAAQRRAPLQKEHLDHYRVSLVRMLNVVHRLRVGMRHASGLDRREAAELCARVREELTDVRDAYMGDWLRTNKWQNVEVSLGVYDDLLESYEMLPEAGRPESAEADGYLMLDLSGIFDSDFLPVGGVPIGARTYNGVPFLFADVHRTHAVISDERPEVEVAFSPKQVADLHLIIAAHKTSDQPHPAAVVELVRRGECVFTEELLNITHLCDWWAPLGEHIWAGGGMAYVDPNRTQYALKPGHMYGLAHVAGFDLPEGLRADVLRIRALEGEELRLFAATVEVAP